MLGGATPCTHPQIHRPWHDPRNPLPHPIPFTCGYITAPCGNDSALTLHRPRKSAGNYFTWSGVNRKKRMWDRGYEDSNSETESTASDSSYHKVVQGQGGLEPLEHHQPPQSPRVEASLQGVSSPVASVDSESSYEVLARTRAQSPGTDYEGDTDTDLNQPTPSPDSRQEKEIAKRVVEAALVKALARTRTLEEEQEKKERPASCVLHLPTDSEEEEDPDASHPPAPRQDMDPRSPQQRAPTPRPRSPVRSPDMLEEIELHVLRSACTADDTLNPVSLPPAPSFATCLALGGAVGEEADAMGETEDIAVQIAALEQESAHHPHTQTMTDSATSSLIVHVPWWQRWCCCCWGSRSSSSSSPSR